MTEPRAVHVGWGRAALEGRGGDTDVVVIVDVLSFSTFVDVATGRGLAVHPLAHRDRAARELAEAKGGLLAGSRRDPAAAFSLSPSSLGAVAGSAPLFVPSPNGATLTLLSRAAATFSGCLRNATAVARAAARAGRRILVVAAGERWPDGSLRPAIEDLLGAGAIAAAIDGIHTPESRLAAAAFAAAKDDLPRLLADCESGRELAEIGYGRDVETASEVDVSRAAPRFDGEAYAPVPGSRDQ